MPTNNMPKRLANRARLAKEMKSRPWAIFVIVSLIIASVATGYFRTQQVDYWGLWAVGTFVMIELLIAAIVFAFVVFDLLKEYRDGLIDLDDTVERRDESIAARDAEIREHENVLTATRARCLRSSLFADVREVETGLKHVIAGTPTFHFAIIAEPGATTTQGCSVPAAIIAQVYWRPDGALNLNLDLLIGLGVHVARTADGLTTYRFYERGVSGSAVTPSISNGTIIKVGARLLIVRTSLDPAHLDTAAFDDAVPFADRQQRFRDLVARAHYTTSSAEKSEPVASGARTPTSAPVEQHA